MVSGPASAGAGMVNAVAETVTVESHPSMLVSVTEITAVPEVFHNTFIEVPVAGPVMLPFVTVQAYVFPGNGVAIEYEVVVVVQTIREPLITGTGWGAITIFNVTMESQSRAFVSVTVMLPVPVEPH